MFNEILQIKKKDSQLIIYTNQVLKENEWFNFLTKFNRVHIITDDYFIFLMNYLFLYEAEEIDVNKNNFRSYLYKKLIEYYKIEYDVLKNVKTNIFLHFRNFQNIDYTTTDIFLICQKNKDTLYYNFLKINGFKNKIKRIKIDKLINYFNRCDYIVSNHFVYDVIKEKLKDRKIYKNKDFIYYEIIDKLKNYKTFIKYKLKQTSNKNIDKKVYEVLKFYESKHENIIKNFDINKIEIKQFDKLDKFTSQFFKAITSYDKKPKPGRSIWFGVYYEKIPIGFIQYSSPLYLKKLDVFMKKYDKNLNNIQEKLKFLNKHVVDLSVCVSYGLLGKFLFGKLIFFIASSKELIEKFNKKYNCDIKILQTTSYYGKSSLYNRIRGLKYLGKTKGSHSHYSVNQIKELRFFKPYDRTKSSCNLNNRSITLIEYNMHKNTRTSFKLYLMPKGFYATDEFYSLNENLNYWYNRWFLPRRKRLMNI